jgi:Flp pilus assembly protein TadB
MNVTNLSWSLVVGLGGISAGLFILAMIVLGSMARSGRQRDLIGRIERYGPRHTAAADNDDAQGARKVSQLALDTTKRLMSPTAQRRLRERLDVAAVARKPAEWALLGGIVGLVVAVAVSLAIGNVLIGVAAGALVGWLSMRFTLSFLIRRRRAAFGEQLPEMLTLIASALQSGFSLPQAFDTVVREGAQPAVGEFSRAIAEARLGAELEDCLEMVAKRMDSADLHWIVLAIRIQRGVGGNLAEVLTTIGGTIRERAYLRRQVHALSAEGRLSAWILIVLPILVATWLFITSPNYMRPLYTTPPGLFMLSLSVVLLIIGTIWMRHQIKLEV